MKCSWKCPFMYYGSVERHHWPTTVKKCKLIEYERGLTYHDMKMAGLLLEGDCRVAALRMEVIREVFGDDE